MQATHAPYQLGYIPYVCPPPTFLETGFHVNLIMQSRVTLNYFLVLMLFLPMSWDYRHAAFCLVEASHV